MNDTSCHFELIEQIHKNSHNKLPISELCAMAGVSRSGYYAWLKAAPSRAAKEEQDRKDFDLILSAYKKNGYSKGARGIYMTLLHMDEPIVMNLKKIRRLMRKYNFTCPIRSPNPNRQSAKDFKLSAVADNLVKRRFEDFGPRVILLTDISYLPYNGAFAYLSTILDAYTKQILAYVVSDSLEEDFVLETVENLVRDHGISLNAQTIIHSDQGVHYTARMFSDILRSHSLRQSMSRRGNCWDNAPQESFFGHMKDHIRAKLNECRTFADVKAVIDDYMDYYNNDRYQWNLAKLSPNEFYSFVTTGIYPLKVPNAPVTPGHSDRKQ